MRAKHLGAQLLAVRVFAAIVFAPALLILIGWGGQPLRFTCMALALLMLWETERLLVRPLAPTVALRATTWCASLAVLACQLGWLPPELAPVIMPGLVAVLLCASLAGQHPPAVRVSQAAAGLLTAMYACGLIPYLWILRQRPTDGLLLALFALFCTWAADTGAYFAGRSFGRRRLSPQISPGKTSEGAVGGLICGVLMGLILYQALGAPFYWLHAAAMGFVAALAGVVGDLSESVLKRAAGAKDSSHLIPGHGGVLDRFDGVLFAAWAVHLYSLVVLP